MNESARKSARQLLATPVQFLKGVGPDRVAAFDRLGLKTARDLLFFFPRDYQDVARVRSLAELEEDELVSIRGVVEEIDLRNTGPGRSMLGVLVRQGGDYLRAVWFNQPFMRDRFNHGQEVLLTGRVQRRGLRWEMPHPRVEPVADQQEDPAGDRVLPVYPLTEGIAQGQLRRLIHDAVATYADLIDDVFPEDFLDAKGLMPIRAAIGAVHEPTDRDELEHARRRLIYQELLVLQLALALRRQRIKTQCKAPPLPVTTKIDARILRLFPFRPTADQQRAIHEIVDDLAREHPMNRLLQGDVGTGKTVVAVYAMLLAVANGYQAALMAPTEVLARQHYQTLGAFLAQARVRVGLLTGTLGRGPRKTLIGQVEQGEIDLLIGTQALVRSGVQFAKLGLTVIDEQHKFGVRQRASLRQAGVDPHYLVMTATPIPRTVSMTLFGDLDVSTLREAPPGRQAIHTYLGTDELRERWWDFFRKKLREGRQAFVVTPLVDQPTDDDLTGVEQSFEALANGPLEAFRLGLVHGRLDPAAKQAAMDDFHAGKTQVLVATSVVEVGIDVPNATVMTIENGERFGLAQLHQLRGRVSRGSYPGYVTVFAHPRTDEARTRLAAFVDTTDGFELAEADFKLRGPGELFGTRQHGLPPLRIADLQRDTEILEQTQKDSRALVANDPELKDPAMARLCQMVHVRYGKVLDLGDVG